jgi:ribosomal protein L14E/L6E/L27E
MAPPTMRPMKIWVVREGRYQGRGGVVVDMVDRALRRSMLENGSGAAQQKYRATERAIHLGDRGVVA